MVYAILEVIKKKKLAATSILTLSLGFVGTSEKVLPNTSYIILSYVSVLGTNHFHVYGGHFTKWRPFP